MLGSGGLISRGGYGGIDPLSNFHGGAGSGGKILIKSCTDNFDGIVDNKGGLTLLPLNYTVLYEKWYNFSDPDLLYNYNVNSQKSKQIIFAGHSGLFGRRLSYFNNTLFNSLPLNNYNDNNFKLYLIYIKNNVNCMNNHVNNSISIVSYNWNNKTINSENSTYISAISESLGHSVGKLYIL